MNGNVSKDRHLSVWDAVLLEKYTEGRFCDPGDSRDRINKLKDSMHLMCITDAETGELFVKTTPLGDTEVEFNQAPPRVKLHRMLASIMNCDDNW